MSTISKLKERTSFENNRKIYVMFISRCAHLPQIFTFTHWNDKWRRFRILLLTFNSDLQNSLYQRLSLLSATRVTKYITVSLTTILHDSICTLADIEYQYYMLYITYLWHTFILLPAIFSIIFVSWINHCFPFVHFCSQWSSCNICFCSYFAYFVFMSMPMSVSTSVSTSKS